MKQILPTSFATIGFWQHSEGQEPSKTLQLSENLQIKLEVDCFLRNIRILKLKMIMVYIVKNPNHPKYN